MSKRGRFALQRSMLFVLCRACMTRRCACRKGDSDSDAEQDGMGEAVLAQGKQEASAVRRPPPKKRHGKPSIIF